MHYHQTEEYHTTFPILGNNFQFQKLILKNFENSESKSQEETHSDRDENSYTDEDQNQNLILLPNFDAIVPEGPHIELIDEWESLIEYEERVFEEENNQKDDMYFCDDFDYFEDNYFHLRNHKFDKQKPGLFKCKKKYKQKGYQFDMNTSASRSFVSTWIKQKLEAKLLRIENNILMKKQNIENRIYALRRGPPSNIQYVPRTTTRTSTRTRTTRRTTRTSAYERELQDMERAIQASLNDVQPIVQDVGISMQLILELSNRELTPEDYELLLMLDDTIQAKTVQENTLEKLVKKSIISKLDEMADPGCVICMMDWVCGDEVSVLPCDHGFHTGCITPWLTENSQSCPLCGFNLVEDVVED